MLIREMTILMKNEIIIAMFLFIGLSGCAQSVDNQVRGSVSAENSFEIDRTEEEWMELLTADQYYVLRQQGTEAAFSGQYHDHKDNGVYTCAGCGNDLFSSETKYRSGTGWPSFYQPVSESKVGMEIDRSYGMVRQEVHCARCGGHLGHVFEDGPEPTGLRYCINSVSLGFQPK